jgi:hypothetical protein
MDNALPRRTPGAPRTWQPCMTSENHGTVGPAGCTFSHAPEKHERVLVLEATAGTRAPVAEFKGYVDGQPAVTWFDRDNMPPVGTKLFAAPFDFHEHLARQAAWSARTFGPGARTKGVCDHIRKELLEIESDPLDLREWIDVVILALDGAWRCGGTPEQIIAGIVAKQSKNEGRIWPDWRTADPDKAIEHDRTFDAAMQASTPGEPKCTCPSGDGSLRWPCDVHQPAAQASTSGERQGGGA